MSADDWYIEQLGASFIVRDHRGEVVCFRPTREDAEEVIRLASINSREAHKDDV